MGGPSSDFQSRKQSTSWELKHHHHNGALRQLATPAVQSEGILYRLRVFLNEFSTVTVMVVFITLMVREQTVKYCYRLYTNVLSFIGAFETWVKWLLASSYIYIYIYIFAYLSNSLSFIPHISTRLPLDEFAWNLIFAYFSKVCARNSSLIELRQEQYIICVDYYVHLWKKNLPGFFVEWEIFQTEVVEKF